ncbi:MAG: hypothetical protein RL181_2982 [Bacteroidota bacterium]
MKYVQHLYPILISLFLFAGLFTACEKENISELLPDNTAPQNHPADVALAWNRLYLELERFTPGYRPPISSRNMAYINLAAYEAIVPGMQDDYASFEGFFQGLQVPESAPSLEYHWPTVLNTAYGRAMAHYFPRAPAAQQFQLFRLEAGFSEAFRKQVSNEVYVRSTEFGRQVADAVFAWSATDQLGHEAYLRPTDPSYIPPKGYGLWQPTSPDYSRALTPYWGKVRPFAADDSDICPDPLPISDAPGSAIYQQALEVKRTVDKIKAGELREQHWIADFWSDDCPILTFSPAGRWIAVANQVVENNKPNLALAVETYARVSMALADAGIRTWHEKYRFNVERPVDYIRRVFNDPTWNTLMCPDGSGKYFTPPFPAYPGGHAAFGAAAAEVLTALYGKQPITDRCHEGRTEFLGQSRHFNDFYAMAQENADSRVPIGVHFEMDNVEGLNLGYRVGKKVNQLPWRK